MEAQSSLWELTIHIGKIISLYQCRRHSLFRRTTVLLDKFLTRWYQVDGYMWCLYGKEWHRKGVSCIMTTRKKKGRCTHDRWLVWSARWSRQIFQQRILHLSITNAPNRPRTTLWVYHLSISIETTALTIENALLWSIDWEKLPKIVKCGERLNYTSIAADVLNMVVISK